jgi:uncharacterized protein (DUF885 family)
MPALRLLISCLLVSCLFTPGLAAAAARKDDAPLDALVARYLADYWQRQPERASAAGLSAHDGRLRTLSTAEIGAEAAALRAMLAEHAAIDPDTLASLDAQVDHDLLGRHARIRLAEIDRFPRWQREPGEYLPLSPLTALLAESDRPAAERADDLRKRLDRLPARYAAGRANLRNPPRLFTENALRTAASQRRLLDETVPAFALTVPGQADALIASAKRASAALAEFETFLRDELLPRSDGPLAAGREQYAFYLRELHGLDLTPEELLALGEKHYARIEAELAAQARRIDPEKTWRQITEDLRARHPARDDLLGAYCRAIQRSRDHVRAKGLVTVPPGEEVRCVLSDPSQRAFSPFGVFQQPAPFADSKVGYLILHPVPEGLDKDREEALLRAHDHTWIDVIAPHEAYPGHHLQALKAQENPRPLRQVYSTPVFNEGWGLYTEELMHETGFYTDPEATRLTQLRLRLWRAARVLLDARLHTGAIDYDQARAFLVRNIGMEEGATAGEVGIYVARPSYAIGYVVGYYEIMQLREDYRRARGAAYDAREFHDRLLTLGSLPMPQVRRLLGLDSPPSSAP